VRRCRAVALDGRGLYDNLGWPAWRSRIQSPCGWRKASCWDRAPLLGDAERPRTPHRQAWPDLRFCTGCGHIQPANKALDPASRKPRRKPPKANESIAAAVGMLAAAAGPGFAQWCKGGALLPLLTLLLSAGRGCLDRAQSCPYPADKPLLAGIAAALPWRCRLRRWVLVPESCRSPRRRWREACRASVRPPCWRGGSHGRRCYRPSTAN